ncbi:MAG: alanine--glyoxylate aminotransferase family protein [Candidatus Aminicenantes bacterium]|nr:alanine--glyoxylate aminotransferase family protein [Candidatus Aminicenantes bacterium]
MAQEKLLLIPGPSPVVPRILDALAKPTVSHVGPDMVHDLKEACENLKKIVFCENGEPFIVSGAGTLSMEMALLNTAGPGDRVLVLSQGYFGRRMADICRAFGLEHDVLECEWGRAVTPRELEARLKGKNYNIVVCTHVDTATGACAPVEEYSQVLEKTGALFIVDGVCATGGVPERMDAWGIDVVLTAAQKCLGTPPGLAILVLSESAMEKRRSLASIPAYYSDLLRWLPIMHDPAKYFSTPCVNEVRAFAEATRIILEEGIEERFERHDLLAEAIRAGLAALGFSFFTDPRFTASTLSVVSYPDGVDDKAFRSSLYENGVVVAGGLAQTLGKVFRMGHMGNLTSAQVRFAIEAVEKSLEGLGCRFKPGSGSEAVNKVLTA